MNDELKEQIPLWIADVSEINSQATFVLDELKVKEIDDLELFPSIAMGAGSLIWLASGRIIEFALNVNQLGLEALLVKTKKILAGLSIDEIANCEWSRY